MKKISRAVLLLAAFALTSNLFFDAALAMGKAPQQDMPAPTDVAPTAQGDQVVAYYFHGAFRCPTCNKMEQYSREAIERDFKDELASGKLAFKAVNVESKGNEHFVNQYQLYTKTLLLSSVKDGKEVCSRNLDKIWEYVGNKNRYENYVRDEVAAFLKET